jgi:hypothetical protein
MRILASAFVSALCLSLLALLGTADPAAANPTAAQLSAIKSNCRSDYMSNCWGVPKGAKAFQCLKEHMAKLSSGCQHAVKAAIPAPAPAATPAVAKPKTVPAAPAPSTAAAKPAATETPPPAPTSEAKATPPAAAPKSAPAALPKAASEPPAKHAKAEPAKAPSPAPAAAPAEEPPIIGFLPPRKKIMVLRNCHQDLETYCADVPFGEGRNLRCLFGHKAALTPDCQGALARLSE